MAISMSSYARLIINRNKHHESSCGSHVQGCWCCGQWRSASPTPRQRPWRRVPTCRQPQRHTRCEWVVAAGWYLVYTRHVLLYIQVLFGFYGEGVKARSAAGSRSGTQQVRVGSGGWVYLEPCLQLGRLFRPHGERTHVYRAAELQPASSSSGTPGAWGWLEHRSSTTRGQECLLRYIWWGLGFIRWFALQSRSVRTPTPQLRL